MFYGAALAYMVVIAALVRIMRNRKPFDLRGVLVFWNGLLSVASAIGALVMVPFVVHELSTHGLRAFICSENWHRYPAVAYVTGLFVWSKLPELLDTVFLALRKREIMLLHWYHHVTVLLYVWWSAHHNVGATGAIFCAMNLVVHAIMYGYYALGSMGYRPPFPIAITILQIAQMIAGTYVVVVSMACSTHDSTTYAALIMYSSYAVLFTLFFLERYVTSKPGKRADPRISAETRVHKAKIH